MQLLLIYLVHTSFLCLLIHRIFRVSAHICTTVWMGWLVATERRANVIYIISYLKTLILNNCSTFLGFQSSNCPQAGHQQDFLSGRQITNVSGWAWEHPGRWKQVKWHDKDRGTHSFRRSSRPLPQGRGLSLTTAQAASWGGKAGSPWCTRKPRCQSSSSRQSPCTFVAPAVLGPAMTQEKHTWAPARGGNQPF